VKWPAWLLASILPLPAHGLLRLRPKRPRHKHPTAHAMRSSGCPPSASMSHRAWSATREYQLGLHTWALCAAQCFLVDCMQHASYCACALAHLSKVQAPAPAAGVCSVLAAIPCISPHQTCEGLVSCPCQVLLLKQDMRRYQYQHRMASTAYQPLQTRHGVTSLPPSPPAPWSISHPLLMLLSASIRRLVNGVRADAHVEDLCHHRVLCSATRQAASLTWSCRALTWRQTCHAQSSANILHSCQSCSGWTWLEPSWGESVAGLKLAV
jgi:hypothetical protein